MVEKFLKGKVAIVTGASRGIGKEISLKLAENGCNLVLSARNLSLLKEVKKKCEKSGVRVLIVKSDIRKIKEIKKIVDKSIKEFGKIDILINNAGVGYAKSIPETEEDDWDLIMDTNAKGSYFLSKFVFEEFIKRKIKGTIINISSSAGKKGYPEQSVYCASKFAMNGFSSVFALEGKKYGIKVHLICPGGVDTEFIENIRPDIPKRTLIKPEDIAETVIFLLKTRPEITIDEIQIKRYASQG